MYDFIMRNGTCRQMTTLSSVGSYIIFPAREVSWEAKIVRDFDGEDNEYGVKAKEIQPSSEVSHYKSLGSCALALCS